MVFTHVIDSVIASSSDAEGHQSEQIKRTGPQLSLKELMSPFGLSKGRLTSPHAIRICSSHLCDQTSSSSQKPSTSRGSSSPVVIVGPEHNFVRRRDYSKESFQVHLQTTDVTEGLPGPGTKFRQPEYSDSRPHGLRETPLAHESHPDSSSEIQNAPFSHGPTFRLPWKEVTDKIIKQQTTTATRTSSYYQTQTSSMSSPKCYKQLNRRSRSIAIKSPQPLCHVSQADTMAAEEDSASNERMYDWATWRMYNRIVDHRRNQRLSLPSLSQPEASTASNAITLPQTALDDYDHGEVFEMEI